MATQSIVNLVIAIGTSNHDRLGCTMSVLVWILLALLVLAPRAAFSKVGRIDWRAMLLLLCLITLMIRFGTGSP